jgi:hypothetical protein
MTAARMPVVGEGEDARPRRSAGESQLHKTLKKEACRWLFRMGYRSIAAEVKLPPLGIVDAVGTGVFRPWHNHISAPRELSQVCIVECKATRADFLRDISREGQFLLQLEQRRRRTGKRKCGRRRTRKLPGVGKFHACMLHPLANIHYVLAPAGMIQKKELPPRWGLLSLGEGGISVVVHAPWQEAAQPGFVDAAIARTLTCDIYRADDRAVSSVNREIFSQQMELARRIRTMKARIVLAP